MSWSRNAQERRLQHAHVQWRDIDWTEENFQKLKRDVDQFVPLQGDSQLKRMNILLLGQISAGKSSFVNTITSIFGDHASQKAESTNSDKSVTQIYRQYPIRSSTGAELTFRLCDTKGIEHGETINTVDIQRMIDGEKPDTEPSEPSYNRSARSTYQTLKEKVVAVFALFGWMKKLFWRVPAPDYNKRVYCVVYVIDSSNVQTLPDNVVNYFKDCRKLMKQNGGIPEIVVLTKADQCCGEEGEKQ